MPRRFTWIYPTVTIRTVGCRSTMESLCWLRISVPQACATRISSAIPTPARGISSPPTCVCSEATAAAGTSGATTPARISSSGNPTICCIGASRACLTCPASRAAPIWSSAWPGPANAFGCRTTIRKAITVGAAHSSCTGPAPCSTTRIGRTTTRTSTAPCCGAPPPISRRTHSNMAAYSSTTTATPSTPR